MVKNLKERLQTNYFLYLGVLMILAFALFQPVSAHADWWSDVTTGGGYSCGNAPTTNACERSGGVWNPNTGGCDPYSPPPSGYNPTTPVPSGHTCLNNGSAVNLHWSASGYAVSDTFFERIFAKLFQQSSFSIPVAHAGGGEPAPPPPPPTITYRYEVAGQNAVYVGTNTSSGQIAITPGADYHYRVTACTDTSCRTSGYRHFRCDSPAPTVTLQANPTTVEYNTASTLTWTSTNTTSCTASGGWSGSKSVSGSQSTGVLTERVNNYTITCTGPQGTVSASAQVNVNIPLPTVTLQANPTKVIHGNPSTLTWTSTNATSCTAFDGWSGNKSTGNGTQSTGPLSANTQYRLVCTGVGGTAQAIASVAVETGTGANLVVDKPNPREKDTLNFTYNVGTSVPNTCVLRRGAVSVLSITSPSGTYQTTASAGETRYILDCPGNPAEVTVKTLPVFQET